MRFRTPTLHRCYNRAVRAGPHALVLFLGLSACVPALDLPETCDEALDTVEPGARGPVLDRAGPVEIGERLPVFRYDSNRSLAMTYGRSVALGCILLDEEPRPNGQLRRVIDDGLADGPSIDSAFDARPQAMVLVDGSEPIATIEVSDPSRYTEIDFDALEPGIHDGGIGMAAAEELARNALAEITGAGVIHGRDLELVASSETAGGANDRTWTVEFVFTFGYVPGGIRAFGPQVEVRVDREGAIVSLAVAEGDLSVDDELEIAIDEPQADALLEAFEPQVQTAYQGVGPAWFPPSSGTGESRRAHLRYYGEVSRGIRWISMMSPDDGVFQSP